MAHHPTYLSFFSGRLGLDLGFHQAGFRCLSLNENDRHALATIDQNLYRFGELAPLLIRESIVDLSPDRIMSDLGIQAGEVDCIGGGPPCQSFSNAGKRRGLQDPRGQLFLRFIEIIAAIRPRYAVIENVRGLLSKKLGALPVILDAITQAGYQVEYKLYDAADFGVPQHRRRVVFLLSRDGDSVPPMVGTHGLVGQPRWVTLRDAIGCLQGTEMVLQDLRPSVLEYIRHVPAGGDWRSIPTEFQTPWLLRVTKTSKDLFDRSAWDRPIRTLTCVADRRTPHLPPRRIAPVVG